MAGASDDSAKMALTPQARTGLAAKVATNAKATLEGAKRLKEPAPQKTVQTPEEQAFQARLQRLGGLGGRIQQMVNQSISSAAQAPTSLEVSPAYVKTLPPTQQEPYREAVGKINQALQSGGAGLSEVLADINTKFNDPMIAETLSKDVASAVSASIAKGVIDPDQININTLMTAGVLKPEDLGDEAEMSKALGSSWLNMTPRQISAAMDRYQAKEAGDVAKLQSQLSDPMLSPMDKEGIRDRLWELGYSGQVARESDVDRLARQVEASGKIMLNGEVRDIEEALSDEGLMNTFEDYLRGDESFKAQFQKANPELAAWLDTNAQGLEQAFATIADTDKKLGEVMEKNNEMFRFEDTSISPTVIQSIFPDWGPGKFYSKELASSNKLWTFLQETKTKDPATAGAIVRTLNALGTSSPDLIQDALEMAMGSPEEFQRLIGGLQNGGTKMSDAVRMAKPIPNLKTASPEDLIDWMFGEDTSVADVESKLADLKAKAPFSAEAAAAYAELAGDVDSNKDGKVDGVAQLGARANRRKVTGGLEGVFNAPVSESADAMRSNIKMDDPLYYALSSVVTGPDDAITGDEMKGLIEGGQMTTDTMKSMYDIKDKIHMDSAALEQLTGALAEHFIATDPEYIQLENKLGLSNLSDPQLPIADSNAKAQFDKLSAAYKEILEIIKDPATPEYAKTAWKSVEKGMYDNMERARALVSAQTAKRDRTRLIR
jgi:hypothetical protein